MEFFNEEGRKVGELKNFANKLVRDPELINQKRQKKEPDGRNAVPAPQAEPAPSEPRRAEASAVLTEQCILYLKELLAARLNKPVKEIDPDIGYYEMGLDSPGLLDMVKEIEQKSERSYCRRCYLNTRQSRNWRDICANITEPVSAMLKAGIQVLSLCPGKKEDDPNPREKVGVSRNAEWRYCDRRDGGTVPRRQNLREFWTNLKMEKTA